MLDVSKYTLTKRQLEVALLASQGLRYAEIGKQLCISVDTVDGHLNRIYKQLGIKGKKELPQVFRNHRLKAKVRLKDLA